MLKKLAELAGELDRRGYLDQANAIDELIKKIANDELKELELEMAKRKQHDEANKAKGLSGDVEHKLPYEAEPGFKESPDGACEMCGEFKQLTNTYLGDTGGGNEDEMMLCKNCKKQYGKR